LTRSWGVLRLNGTRFTPPMRCILHVGKYKTVLCHTLLMVFTESELKREMETGQQVRLMLRWIFSRLHWVAHTEIESLYVDDTTYNRCLKAYLASQGIEWKTWTHYMQPAEQAWKRQCEAEARLQADLDFWRSIPGVRVVSRGKEAQAVSKIR
jgi:hypothetical protein